MDRILIVIPVYNEGENIEKVIADIRDNFRPSEILAVNDKSIDDTVDKLDAMKVNRLDLPFNMGYAGAIQAGFKYAAKGDYDYVVQFDGDGQHLAAEIGKLYNHIKENKADIVIGSRFKINTDYPHPFFRRIASKIFSLLIRITCGKKITDPTSGFQILGRKAFTKYSGMFNYPHFPDANLIIKMLLLGFTIEETPVKMRKREYGTEMHSGIIGPVKYMIQLFYSILIIILTFKISNHSKEGGADV